MNFPVRLDDAAALGPGHLPLERAVPAHRHHLEAPYGPLVGPLVLAPEHLPRLHGAGPLDLAVVVPDAHAAADVLEQLALDDELNLVALEVSGGRTDELLAVVGSPAGVQVYVELPRTEARAELIARLAESSYRAKVRTGGAVATAHPGAAELAETLALLARHGVLFKATAGLHHALRTTDAGTGFEQHGILNVLCATEAALLGADVDELVGVLDERDATSLPDATALPEHSLFVSVGTCSVLEPVEELTRLGLIGPGVVAL